MMGLLPRTRIFVEEAKSSDADSFAEIHADAFAHPWSAEDFASLVRGTGVFALVVRRDSLLRGRRAVGFVIVRMAADEAEILTIGVRGSGQGRGYGRLLMDEALRRLYHERMASCFLEVDEGNQAALGLYRKLGFETVGSRKGYYQSGAGGDRTALVMRLQLR